MARLERQRSAPGPQRFVVPAQLAQRLPEQKLSSNRVPFDLERLAEAKHRVDRQTGPQMRLPAVEPFAVSRIDHEGKRALSAATSALGASR